jgi:carbamoyl-phosphate synthase large subunit
MNILINGIGGPTPRSISRALRDYSRYRRYELIGTDVNPLARDLYEYRLYNHTYLIPPAGHPDYWDTLEDLVAKHEIDLALVQPELEVMAWAKRARTAELPCKALIPDYDLAQLLVDKYRMTEVLAGEGLVPTSVELDPAEGDFAAVERALPYPFWIRSTTGSSGLGSLKIEDRAALRNWLLINPGVSRFIASTYLPGRNLACKLLYYEGELIRAACAERVNYIMAKVAPSGITGNTSFGRLLNEPELVATATRAMDRLFAATDAPRHGFFTVDFKEDAAGRPYVTEVNIRHVAFSICFAAGGATFAEDTVRLLDNDPTFDRSYRMYTFEPDLIFLRDVDAAPILMRESQLLTVADVVRAEPAPIATQE